MKEDLEKILKTQFKPSSNGGYEAVFKDVHFSISEIPNEISIVYYYVGRRTAIAPTSVLMSGDTNTQQFCKKTAMQ